MLIFNRKPPAEDAIKTGVVIGSFGMPDMVKLNVACIRKRCGEIPIMISDDCSPGFGQTPESQSQFGGILEIARKNKNVIVWPNVDRIGHAGGDMAAFWKAIIWGASTGLEVVYKLSQRYIIDIEGWDQRSAKRLLASGLGTLGQSCIDDGWDLRTEAVGMKVDLWNKRHILAHLTPRQIAYPTEHVVYDDVRNHLGDRICPWDLMSVGRKVRQEGVLFRACNEPEEYARLARRLNVIPGNYDTRESTEMDGYIMG